MNLKRQPLVLYKKPQTFVKKLELYKKFKLITKKVKPIQTIKTKFYKPEKFYKNTARFCAQKL